MGRSSVSDRATLIYSYMLQYKRIHFKKADLSRGAKISVKDITPAVMKKVREFALDDGLFIPWAVGSGLYILTDNANDVVGPEISLNNYKDAINRTHNEHMQFLSEKTKDLPPTLRRSMERRLELHDLRFKTWVAERENDIQMLETYRKNVLLEKKNKALEVLAGTAPPRRKRK